MLLEGISYKGIKPPYKEVIYESKNCSIIKAKNLDRYHVKSLKLSLGNVLYNNPNGSGTRNYNYGEYNHIMIVHFNIGELKPTISREDIDESYKNTKELIADRIKAAKNEVAEYYSNLYDTTGYHNINVVDGVWNRFDFLEQPKSYTIRNTIAQSLYYVTEYIKGYDSNDPKAVKRRTNHILDKARSYRNSSLSLPDYWCEDIDKVSSKRLDSLIDDESEIINLADCSPYWDKIKEYIDHYQIPHIDEVEEVEIKPVKTDTPSSVFGRLLRFDSDGAYFENRDYHDYELTNRTFYYGFGNEDKQLKAFGSLLKSHQLKVIKISKANLKIFKNLGAEMIHFKDYDKQQFINVLTRIKAESQYGFTKYEFMRGIGKAIPSVQKLVDVVEDVYNCTYKEVRSYKTTTDSVTASHVEIFLEGLVEPDHKALSAIEKLNKLYDDKYKKLDIYLSDCIISGTVNEFLIKLIKQA